MYIYIYIYIYIRADNTNDTGKPWHPYFYAYQKLKKETKEKKSFKAKSSKRLPPTLREICLYSKLFWSGPYLPAFGLIAERYSVSLRIQSECGKILISPYSVRMRENTDQNNSEYGHFLRSAMSKLYYFSLFRHLESKIFSR